MRAIAPLNQLCQRFHMFTFDFSRCNQLFKFFSHKFLVSRPETRLPTLNELNDENPRQIAVRVLRRRETGDEFTENLLENTLSRVRLSPADRGFCQELVYGVVRWQATLDWLVARKTGGREQKPALQNLLRLGLYQIFWLDRIPPHAAVHETVEIAKRSGYGSQAGFINAVLRGYLREAEATKEWLAGLKVEQPALGFSQPDWLVERWRKQFGDENTFRLLEWNNTPPRTFARVNSLKSGREGPAALEEAAAALVTRWREENVEYDFFTRDWTGENLLFELKSHPPLAGLGSFREGWFYVQDPSTLLAVVKLGAQPGETVLDLCAAPGGKTTFIAQQMRDRGRILATDISEERLKLVGENSRRLGITCIENETIAAFDHRPPGAGFDRILVDAPCSNTGVLRRRVDLRWRISADEIVRLHKTQLELLTLAASRLKPGGILVYSTCSLEPEENSGVIKEFLAAHQSFKLESARELSPFADGVDGAFVARLEKIN
jgi:16S rRNA (cytosine967-C5)-methyltransferase